MNLRLTLGGACLVAISAMEIQVGIRPYFLINDMKDSPLKTKLESCADMKFQRTEYAIGHRGACLMFPEHSKESYIAAARMGAGIIECDVNFTKDLELVCRHDQADLATTTNILVTPLASKCTKPFQPYDPVKGTPATAECRLTDITLAEYKTLKAKMDGFNPNATTPAQFIVGTPSWRTDLYNGPLNGQVMTHKESITLFKQLGVKMTPELKMPVVDMPFNGFTMEMYAQKFINEYHEANVSASQVFAQSVNKTSILYWVKNEPEFGKNAIYLDFADDVKGLPSAALLKQHKVDGINTWAPALWSLLDKKDGKLVPSQTALDAKAAGLDLIAWTLERSGLMAVDHGSWYYQTVNDLMNREGDVVEAVDVLFQQVGIRGLFSDWSAIAPYYANCILEKPHC
uniref:glycerophosphodiester phosphodiesterase n=1 Tax=Thraustotheca clavata TaxID=74557 RepID=A0A0A7CLX6_9STRA|nr:secreted protein [Thraustotheca clavata]